MLTPDHRSVIIEWTIYFTLLFEYMCALFWQSDDGNNPLYFPTSCVQNISIYTIFGFACLLDLMHQCMCCKNAHTIALQYVHLISTITIQISQAVVFMIICDGPQVYSVFILCLIIQIALEIYDFVRGRNRSPHTDARKYNFVQEREEDLLILSTDAQPTDAENKEENETTGKKEDNIFQRMKTLMPLIVPVMYNNKLASPFPFRSLGFGVYITFAIWLALVMPAYSGRLNNKQSNRMFIIFCFIHGAIIFVICLTEWDLASTWIFVIGIPCCMCCCIGAKYYVGHEVKTEQRVYDFVLKYADNGCSLDDIKHELIDLNEKRILWTIQCLQDYQGIYTKNGNKQYFYANPNPIKWKKRLKALAKEVEI